MNELSPTYSKLNILSLEDSVLDFEMICLQLTDAGIQFEIDGSIQHWILNAFYERSRTISF